MTTITTKYPFIGYVDTRIGGRDENQDNAGFVDTPLGLLLVVCDGMGGGPSGRTASRLVVDTMLNILADVSPSTPRDQALKYAIEKANDTVYSNAMENPELRGMGTTIAAVIVNEKSAVIAHVGDTRIYLLRKGNIVFRSNDHSLVANLVREHKITEEEARNHPRSNVITKALGIRPDIEPEMNEISFQSGDRFILCTDGIWGAMPQQEMVNSLSRTMGINELVTQVLEEIDALGYAAGGGHDNMTLAVLDSTFDSVAKKISKMAATNAQANETSHHNLKSILLRVILLTLAIAILTALAVYFYSNFKHLGNKESHLDEKSFRIAEQADTQEIYTSAADDNDTMSPSTPQSRISQYNPLNEKKMHEVQSILVIKKIDTIDAKLDSLKRITSSDRKQLQLLKRSFVEKEILPDILFLVSNVNQRKKQELGIIKNMLNDNKTIGASKFGKSTEDSNKHIDMIKKRLKKLRD